MTYEQYMNNLREQQDNDRLDAEADNEPFDFDYYHESDYWDCLECLPPPEFLEDTPQ